MSEAKNIIFVLSVQFGAQQFLYLFLFLVTLFIVAGHLDAAEKLQISVRVQSVLAYAMFLPLFLYILFAGKYLKSMGYDGAAKGLTFVSSVLTLFGVLQMVLSFVGVYG